MNTSSHTKKGIKTARIGFLLFWISFCIGDILWILGLYSIAYVIILLALTGSLWSRYYRYIIISFVCGIIWGFALGHHENITHKNTLKYLTQLTENFEKKADITLTIDTILYTKERTKTYKAYIDNFDTFDNFDIWNNTWENLSQNRLYKVSVFVEVPENLAIYDGDRLRFRWKIEPTLRFPLTDFERYAYFHGGYGRIFLTNFEKTHTWKKWYIYSVQERWKSLFESYFPRDVAWTLLGMTIGSIELIESDLKKAFIESGTSHILVVSGANIAFLIILASFFMKYLPLSRIWRHSIVISIILFYGTLVWWEVSVVRATIMWILSYSIVEYGGRGSSKSILILTGIILILYEPLSPLYDAGFGLSFGATLGILLFEKPLSDSFSRIHTPKVIISLMTVTLWALCGSLPILIYHFGEIAIGSLMANILIGWVLGWILSVSVIFATVASISHIGGILSGWLIYIPTRYIIMITDYFQYGYHLSIPISLRPHISLFFLWCIVFFFIESEFD